MLNIMAQNASGSRERLFIGGLDSGADGQTGAEIWLALPSGDLFRYEADVFKAGQNIDTLTGPTREAVTQELERRYGISL